MGRNGLIMNLMQVIDAEFQSTLLDQLMRVIELEAHVEHDKGFITKAMLLSSIPGYEHFESYIILPNGKVCSGKGGKFKRLSTLRHQYALSCQRPFEKFYQVMVPIASIVELAKKNINVAEFVTIHVK